MIPLLLVACQSPTLDVASGDVTLDVRQLLFEAVAGECDETTLTVTNGTDDTVTLAVSEPLAGCADTPFRSVASSVSLGAASAATLEVRYCPTVATSCAGTLALTWTDGTVSESAEIELFGVAWSPDADADGYRVSDGDCDDATALVNPGATETEDARDNDCDLVIDEETPSGDDDGDGFTEREGDCDDTNPLAWPGVPEIVNGVDDDCNGRVDDHTDAYDDDGDGYTEGDGDCNDLNASMFPLATEFPELTPNGLDDDCDGLIDETTP